VLPLSVVLVQRAPLLLPPLVPEPAVEAAWGDPSQVRVGEEGTNTFLLLCVSLDLRPWNVFGQHVYLHLRRQGTVLVLASINWHMGSADLVVG
jgi:hypothetical protein